MGRHVLLTLTTLLILVLTTRPAEAYIDPGSASYVFQVLAGLALGAIFLLRTYWNRLITGIRSLVSRDPAHER
jgi:hypothetical protein